MTLLITGIVVFLGLHLLPTLSGLRETLVGVLARTATRRCSRCCRPRALCCWFMASPRRPWSKCGRRPAERWVAIVLMLPAFIFLVAAHVPGQIKARLKHPFLVAIKTWALAHLIANGDLASIILFGSFVAYAVYDRITLKRRQATGLVTVAASGPPRNDLIAVVFGTVLYGVFLVWLHPLLIGTGALAELGKWPRSGPFFALQNFLYFCHKTEGPKAPTQPVKEPNRGVAGFCREAGDRA